jgi:hypothetical protein
VTAPPSAPKPPPVDLARLLPPGMRKAMSAGFPWVRLGVWLFAVAMFALATRGSDPSTHEGRSFVRSVAYEGQDGAFELGRTSSGEAMRIRGVLRSLEVEAQKASVNDESGQRWTLTLDDKARLVATHPTEPGLTIRGHGKDQWVVLDASGARRWKLKLSDGGKKLGIYGADGKRVARAKDGDPLRIRDDAGAELAVVHGGLPLAEAAWLAVPMPLEVRVLAMKLCHGLGVGEGDEPADDKAAAQPEDDDAD